MRNKYTKEFKEFIKNSIDKYTQEEFIKLLQHKFNVKLSKDALRSYLRKHKIKERYTDYKENMARSKQKYPIGAERRKKDGIYMKVAQPNVWRRKSRVMYEKYHNCKLSDEDYILFLNGDRNDFSKENLIKSSKREMAYLHNYDTFSKNPKLTELGILSAKLMIKAKNCRLLNENR